MKRITILTVTLLLVLNLCSCALIQRLYLGMTDLEMMGSLASQLFSSIQDKDKERFCETFSAHVSSAEGFGSDIEKLFGYVKGNVTSWNEDGSPVIFDSTGENGKIKEMCVWYDLITDEEHYYVFLNYVAVNSTDRYDEGFNSLWIIIKNDVSEWDKTTEDLAAVKGISIPVYGDKSV